MKKITSWMGVLALMGVAFTSSSQEITRQLRSFNKIVISPKINLVLTSGNAESVRIEYHHIEPGRINIELENEKLKIYLDDARLFEKEYSNEDGHNRKQYDDATVTAYVTYRNLDLLEVRGDQNVEINHLDTDEFHLRVYGEAEIRIDSLEAHSLKVVAYGENKIKFNGGRAKKQRYVLYGENKIDSRSLEGSNISTNIYGEGRLSVNASDEVKINSIGEPTVMVRGTSYINKGIVIGKTEIVHRPN